MKILHKTLVAAGVATAVFAAGAAQAATISSASNVIPPMYAKTIVNESTRTVISPEDTLVQLSGGESLSVDDSVTFTLSSGTFAAIAADNLTASPNTGGATFALVDGGIGKTYATYRVTTAPTDAADLLTLGSTATTGAAADWTITGTAIGNGGSVNNVVTMSGFVGGVATSLFGSPLTELSVMLAPTYVVTIVPSTADVWSVASGFTTLTTSTTAPVSTSGTGTITPVANGNATTSGTTAGQPAGVPTPAALLMNISGPMTGVTAITAPNAAGSTALGGASTPPVAGGFAIDTANDNAYGTTVTTAPVDIDIVFDGSVAYDAGAYVANVRMLTDTTGGYSANPSVATGATHVFSRDGSSFTTNSFGPLNKLTVTDRSGGLGGAGADGAIAITAYDTSGAEIACTGLSIPNIPNNGTVTIQGTTITDACVGAKRIEGVVNSRSIQSTNTKITADGATNQAGNNSTSNTIAN